MKNWFVLQTKPLKEAVVEKLLNQAGMRTYYPRIKDEEGRIHSFFPCYEFVYFNYPAQYRLVRFTHGVSRVVGNEKRPIPVEASLIHEIKAREVGGFVVLEEDQGELQPGDLVKIAKGPLKGFKGVFKKTLSGEERVLILLNYVNYQGRVVVPREFIRRTRP